MEFVNIMRKKIMTRYDSLNNRKIITITDPGLTYSTYETWINYYFPNYKNKWHRLGHLECNEKAFIIGVKPHKISKRKITESINIFLIQSFKNNKVYIMGEDGFEYDEI
jgi:hypothetical protein